MRELKNIGINPNGEVSMTIVSKGTVIDFPSSGWFLSVGSLKRVALRHSSGLVIDPNGSNTKSTFAQLLTDPSLCVIDGLIINDLRAVAHDGRFDVVTDKHPLFVAFQNNSFPKKEDMVVGDVYMLSNGMDMRYIGETITVNSSKWRSAGGIVTREEMKNSIETKDTFVNTFISSSMVRNAWTKAIYPISKQKNQADRLKYVYASCQLTNAEIVEFDDAEQALKAVAGESSNSFINRHAILSSAEYTSSGKFAVALNTAGTTQWYSPVFDFDMLK